MIFWSKGDIT